MTVTANSTGNTTSNTSVCKEGDVGQLFYIIETGIFDVVVKRNARAVSQISKGSSAETVLMKRRSSAGSLPKNAVGSHKNRLCTSMTRGMCFGEGALFHSATRPTSVISAAKGTLSGARGMNPKPVRPVPQRRVAKPSLQQPLCLCLILFSVLLSLIVVVVLVLVVVLVVVAVVVVVVVVLVVCCCM